jgi:hypothetical protein
MTFQLSSRVILLASTVVTTLLMASCKELNELTGADDEDDLTGAYTLQSLRFSNASGSGTCDVSSATAGCAVVGTNPPLFITGGVLIAFDKTRFSVAIDGKRNNVGQEYDYVGTCTRSGSTVNFTIAGAPVAIPATFEKANRRLEVHMPALVFDQAAGVTATTFVFD